LARKLGAKPETLLAMNNLDDAKSVRAGESIYLPVRARELGALLSHRNDTDVYVAVKKGDTLYSIAKRHGLTAAELLELNELTKTAKLRIGQRLRISQGRSLTAGGM
jgi:membrane-bound lytic murein transglycosylase D